jgi:hypothetical protein
MNDLHQALSDIASIRRQMARSAVFRGYGPATIAATSVFALSAAALQTQWISDPMQHLIAYLTLWIATAALSAALIGAQMYTRSRRLHSSMSGEMIHLAVAQFLPSAGAGLLLTFVLLHYVPQASWMLPGLWQIIFSLGIFSSCRFLPRHMAVAGFWYLATGLACVALGESQNLSPWLMGVPYAIGQILIAAILLFTSKEIDDEI